MISISTQSLVEKRCCLEIIILSIYKGVPKNTIIKCQCMFNGGGILLRSIVVTIGELPYPPVLEHNQLFMHLIAL